MATTVTCCQNILGLTPQLPWAYWEIPRDTGVRNGKGRGRYDSPVCQRGDLVSSPGSGKALTLRYLPGNHDLCKLVFSDGNLGLFLRAALACSLIKPRWVSWDSSLLNTKIVKREVTSEVSLYFTFNYNSVDNLDKYKPARLRLRGDYLHFIYELFALIRRTDFPINYWKSIAVAQL